MNRRILIGFGVALAAIVVFLVTRSGSVEVSTVEARLDTLSVTIPAEGRTRARDQFTVAAPVSGRLTRLDLTEGDMVTEGQLLGRLFPAPDDPRVAATARAEVSAAEARYQDAEARLREAELLEDQAEREVERRRPLLEIGAIARERMEQAELAAVVATQRRESATAGLATARAALTGARARLLGAVDSDVDVRAIEVRAPVSGRVLSVPDESERVVLAGSPLVVLADAGGLEMVLDILSEDAVRVQAGNDVVITGWGGEGKLRGSVRTVTLVGYTKVSALGVEEQRVDVIADLHEVPAALGTGYRVSGEIVVWQGVDVLTIPASALFRAGEVWQVFVASGGRAELRDVTIGHRNEGAAEVVDGLASGEEVIVFPPETLEDGTPIS